MSLKEGASGEFEVLRGEQRPQAYKVRPSYLKASRHSEVEDQLSTPTEPVMVAYRVGLDGVYATLPQHQEFGFTVCALCGMAYILLIESTGKVPLFAVPPAQRLLMERAVNASHATGHPHQLRSDEVSEENAQTRDRRSPRSAVILPGT